MSDQYPYQIKENVGSTNQAGNSGNTGTTGYTPNSAAQNQGVPNQSSNNNLAKTIVIIVVVLLTLYIGWSVFVGVKAYELQQRNQQNTKQWQEQYEDFKNQTTEQYYENIRKMNEK